MRIENSFVFLRSFFNMVFLNPFGAIFDFFLEGHVPTPDKNPDAKVEHKNYTEKAHSKEDRDEDVVYHAAFADTAYKPMNEKEATLERHLGQDHGYELDRTLTNTHQTVFVNTSLKRVITANRGTADVDDLMTDVALVKGHESTTRRFRQSAKHFEKVLGKYDSYEHILTGHSLGGSVNDYLDSRFNGSIHEIHNYNRGASAKAALQGLAGKITKVERPHVHDYYVAGDPISTLGMMDGTRNIHLVKPYEDSSNPHSLSQFL